MAKLFALLPKRDDVTVEYFHEHWRTIHKDHALNMRRLQRYVQGHRVEPQPEGFPPAPFAGFDAAPYHGIAEAWFTSPAEALGMGEDPDYVNGALKDEPNFMDTSKLGFVVADERVVLAGPAVAQDDPGTKVVFLLRRNSELSPEGFQDLWEERFSEMFTQLPEVVRHHDSFAVQESYADGAEPSFDGVTEVWWSDVDHCLAAMSSPGMETLREELATVIAPGSAAVLETELRPIWPEK